MYLYLYRPIKISEKLADTDIGQTLIAWFARWREALQTRGTLQDLQELFEITLKFKDRGIKTKLERVNDLGKHITADQIAAALIEVHTLNRRARALLTSHA